MISQLFIQSVNDDHMDSSILNKSNKLKERSLLHKRITDLAELQRIYDLGEVLGKGSFGTVVKANHKASNFDWAIKIINKSQAGASRVLLVEREIYILKLVNHPNIILLDRVFESPKTIYLVFELCTGSLAKTFKAKKRFEETETLNVIRSLAGALSYLHKNGIVHRDLKLENILIAANPQNPDDDLHIKVTDFGLSAVRGGTGYENMLHDCCGTLTYMAPEMIASKSYSQQCDVWSMGIIMYVLIVGKFPFYSTNNQQLYSLVKTQEIDFATLPCSPEAKHLLSKMLQKNPAFRMTAAEVENHPWISGRHSIVHVHSSNVLDMMRMWKPEMMEPTEDKDGSENTSGQNADCSKEISVGVIIPAGVTSAAPAAVGTSKGIIMSKVINSRRDQELEPTNESPYTKHRFWDNPKFLNADATHSGPKVSETLIIPAVSVRPKTQNVVSVATDTSDVCDASANHETGRRLSGVEPTAVAEEKRIGCSAERRRVPSLRVPDFSHVQAKVDTNLANLRREAHQAQRRRGHVRNHQSASLKRRSPVPWENK